MEGAGEKRKTCNEDEEDDEQKIEQFFAIIRNIREARERLRNDSDVKKKKQKLVEEEMKKIQVWKPTFERGDFMEEEADHDHRHHQLKTIVGSSHHGDEGTKKEDHQDKEELDLKLSL
jgi:ABC-type nickel/cobalt efflux system permease component RcnA